MLPTHCRCPFLLPSFVPLLYQSGPLLTSDGHPGKPTPGAGTEIKGQNRKRLACPTRKCFGVGSGPSRPGRPNRSGMNSWSEGSVTEQVLPGSGRSCSLDLWDSGQDRRIDVS